MQGITKHDLLFRSLHLRVILSSTVPVLYQTYQTYLILTAAGFPMW
jgi:hypothetical protein